MEICTPYSRQNGLSLIEVLAALVLLGIVFIGIMTVFPQMTLFNERTDAKLDTMNLARFEMQHLQQSSIKLGDDTTIEAVYTGSIYQNVTIQNVTIDLINYKQLKFSSNDYDFEILINLTRESVSVNEETANLDDVSLHLVTMSIYKDGQKRSKTYGYIVQKEEVST